MEKQITIKYKIIENVLLITDEKENDKIIYLNEKIPDNKDNGLIIKSLNDKNYKVLLNMNEIKFNINEKIQRIKKEIFEYELKKPSKNRNQSLLNFFIFLLQIKFYKEYILNKLFGNIPTDKYMLLKNKFGKSK
jgi:lipopolysaccharide export LptBFGC system permease protein LptF